jgi:hypothetical protein
MTLNLKSEIYNLAQIFSFESGVNKMTKNYMTVIFK